MNQKQIWNKIALQWHNFRQKPTEEVIWFLNKYCKNKGKVIDIGCGNARNIIPFAKLNFECYGIDFSEEMLKNAKDLANKNKIKINLELANIIKIPYPNNSFDYCLHLASLHHLNTKEEQFKSLQETYRVLKKEGLVLLTVWNKLQLKFLLKPKDTYVSWKINNKVYKRYYYLFTYFELKKLIKKTNFKIIYSKLFGKNILFVLKK
ncbi:MAG: class I SAM-dependent methyltransferase [Nanoarchaeota archaeon]